MSCAGGFHGTCRYLISAHGPRLRWCGCACHHEWVLTRIRDQMLTRGLFEPRQLLASGAGISSEAAEEPVAVWGPAQSPAAAPDELVDQVAPLQIAELQLTPAF